MEGNGTESVEPVSKGTLHTVKLGDNTSAGIIMGCEIERFSSTFQRNLIEFDALRGYFL